MRTIALLFILLLSTNAFASNAGVTYQGRILKPDGSPLSGQYTQFKLQLRSPDSQNCLLYEEIQSQDLRNSRGVFSLTINDGTGTRTDSTGFTLDRIFANQGSLVVAAANCNSGTGTYLPNSSDGRMLAVLFKDETMGAWEPIPAAKINFVPFAFETKQIAGFTQDSLLRVVNGSGDPLTGVSPLSNAQWTELQALIGGTSTFYSHAGQIAGAAAPSMTSGQVLGWNGTAWTSVDPLSGVQTFAKTALPACAAGEYLRNSAGALVCSTPSGGGTGTVTQVNTGTGLTGGGFTTTGTISISAGGVGTTELAALAVTTAKLADGNVTLVKLAADSVDSSKITDGSITGADLNGAISVTTSGTIASGSTTTRDFKLFPSSGSNKITFAASGSLSTDYTLTWPLTAGGAGQALITDGAGNLSWTAIGAAAGIRQDVTNGWVAAGPNANPSGSGSPTVAIGQDALDAGGGWGDVAIGKSALTASSSSGWFNTAVGGYAASALTSANDVTAIGFGAAGGNTTGSANTALGAIALQLNVTGSGNIAIGDHAMYGIQTLTTISLSVITRAMVGALVRTTWSPATRCSAHRRVKTS